MKIRGMGGWRGREGKGREEGGKVQGGEEGVMCFSNI